MSVATAIRNFLRKNWVGLLGLLFGLIGIALSVVFYTQTLASREPVFLVDPNRTEIIRADRVSDAPLKIVRTEGGEISGDISSVRVYLWNRGNTSIKPENILRPLKLTLGDPQGEILDFRILKRSRGVVAPEIARFPEDSKRVLSVKFKILEQNDGFCLQIIYLGSFSADITIDGQVEGVPYRIGASQIEESRFWVVYLNKVKAFAILLIAVVAATAGVVVFSYIADYVKNKAGRVFKVLETCIQWGKVIVFAAMIIWFVIWILIMGPVKMAKKEARQSLVESVPSSIVPLQEPSEMPNN